ncbi:outer membrane lipoprotein carrier protein LolA [Volucribacter psittacicida]|uniref:Outer membrane lipoprotein carrier protein LolA n=1 Tax=Volucribacter psittacicida TaxID=203482 RepID=A0A4R1G525_9PAST|nr:outer membrane lipoprotein carrier protein LolA [Volucribacter psittacicida]TCK01530.1 outer membrane lipoprotein carrier protein LolA [Volucribacter psittacicida]
MKKMLCLLLCLISNYSFALTEHELMALLQQPKNLQGQFTQQRYLNNLSQPMTTSGEFTLVAQQGLLWQMEKPFNHLLKVTPQGIMQWNGQQWIANSHLAQKEQIKLFLGLLSGDLSPLKSQFHLQLSGTPQQWQLELQPHTLIMQKIFKKIEISGDQYVRTIRLIEQQGDKTEISFEQIQRDIPLSEFIQKSLFSSQG